MGVGRTSGESLVAGVDQNYPASSDNGPKERIDTDISRYANRIRNGTFEVNGETFNIAQNEHDGKNTLHGGDVGYDAVSVF